MIHIDILLTEQEMAHSFLSALKDRYLPERFFYWFPLSCQAWLDLCSDGAYKNFMRSYQLISTHAADMATRLPAGEVEVISLGAGQGNKELLILKALEASGHRITYIPVDASQTLLEVACLTAAQEGFSSRGVKANLADLAHLQSLLPPKNSNKTRLVLFLGNTLGAFDPANYIKTLRRLLDTGDFLLVDGEIYFKSQTMAGYDNPLNRRFAFAPLLSIGITSEDGSLRFETQEDPSQPGLYQLTKYFVPSHDLQVQVAGHPITLQQGQKIQMSSSGKYSRNRFLHLIGQVGHFHCEAEYLMNDETFMMVLLTPKE